MDHSKASLKTSFKVETKVEAFYTGGKIQFTSNGEYCFCSCGSKIQVVNTKTGRISKTLEEDDDDISCFTLSDDDEILVTASRSLLLRQWDWSKEKVTRKWKTLHNAPIVSMAFDSTSTLLATGSADSTIKIWDIIKQYCTHNFRGSLGVVHLVQFHPDPEKIMLFSSSADSNIRIWDLNTSKCIATLSGHYSHVTSLSFLEESEQMISAGRDKVVIFWDLPTRTSLKTVPVYESIESLIALPVDTEVQWCKNATEGQSRVFITTGEKGKIRAWSFPSGRCIFSQEVSSPCIEGNEGGEASAVTSGIVQCMLVQALGYITTVTDEHNITMYNLSTLSVAKQFVGHYDEILDLKFVAENDSMVAIASNSPEIKVVDIETMDCRTLNGHTNTVMSLDASCNGRYIASCSKDNSVRLWKLSDDRTFICVAVAVGHTHAIGTISWTRMSMDYLVSGSQDLTLKCWKVPQIFEEGKLTKISAVWTIIAHDRDINSVVFSPNDKLIASGSQDKTVKIWLASDGSLYGTLRGHKRGVWCVAFSPVDKCVASASADSTIKIWAIQDLTCVKTFEGHTNSVLKLGFMTRGMQVVSSGSDGLIKIWNVKTNECVNTLDEHVDKVWSLAVNKSEDTVITGGGDSVLNIWKDVTEEELLMEEAKQEEMILKDQELSNLLVSKQHTKAIALALTLDRPFRVLSIFKDLIEQENGKEKIEMVVNELREDQIDSLLKFMRDWNTNAKHCLATQTVLSTILKRKSPEYLAGLSDMKESIEALLPYTERHFNRLNRLLQQSTFLEYTWQMMKLSTNDFDVDMSDDHKSLADSDGASKQTRVPSPTSESIPISTQSAPANGHFQSEKTFSDADGGEEVPCNEQSGDDKAATVTETDDKEEAIADENKENEKVAEQEEASGILVKSKNAKRAKRKSQQSSSSSLRRSTKKVKDISA